MNSYSFFITPVAGGIIGYFTNWLAIKMLFRPYEEKKFLNFRIPFTPGLLAKERFRMSKNIGKTVSEYLVTDDVLADALAHKDFGNQFDRIFNDAIEKVIGDNFTVDEYLLKIFKNEKIGFVKTIELDIQKIIKGNLKKNDLLENFIDNIEESIIEIINSKKTLDLVKGNVISLSESIEENLKAKILNQLESEKKIGEILGIENIIVLKDKIGENIPHFTAYVNDFMQSEKSASFDDVLSKGLRNIIDNSLGKFVAAFINYDKIYIGIKESFLKYINENPEDFYEKIMKYLDALLEKNISEIFNAEESKIPKDLSAIVLGIGKKYIIGSFFEDEENEKGLFDFISKKAPNFRNNVDQYLKNNIYEYMEKNSDEISLSVAKYFVENILNFKICNLFLNLGSQKLVGIKSFIRGLIIDFAQKASKFLAEGIDVSALVETQINEMHVKEMENIVVSVAEKELKAITWLGGLLGFIIGFIPAFINWYKF